jgi:hypothetical protein
MMDLKKLKNYFSERLLRKGCLPGAPGKNFSWLEDGQLF